MATKGYGSCGGIRKRDGSGKGRGNQGTSRQPKIPTVDHLSMGILGKEMKKGKKK